MNARPLLPLVLLLAGCSSYSVARSPSAAVAPTPPDQATICVLRDDDVPAPLYTTVVYDNGKLVGATKNDTYFCYLAEPGTHAIRSDGTFGDQRATLEAAAGVRYYLKQAWLIPAVRGHALSWIDEPPATERLRGDEMAVLEEVPATEVLPGRVPFAPARQGDRN